MSSARPAATKDFEDLVWLLEEAFLATESLRGGLLLADPTRHRSAHERVDAALSSAERTAIVGEFENVVLGAALAHLQASAVGTIAVVEELWVHPPAREVGIGEAMLEATKSWASAVGAVAIDIQVLPGDREMKNLCERSGLVARALTMHCRLG